MFRLYGEQKGGLGAEPGEENRERGGKGERNRDRVNQMQSERNQNPPTGNRAKLLFSLYGKNSPKSHRIALGVESKSC